MLLETEASRYCALIENEGLRGALLTSALIVALVDLLQVAYHLPNVEPQEPDLLPDVSEDEWDQVFRGLGSRLDAGYYWTTGPDILPFEAEPPQLGIGDLCDDLAEIWRDLVTGLRGIKDGAAPCDAVWQWKLDFESHWGEHAVDALRILHALKYDEASSRRPDLAALRA